MELESILNSQNADGGWSYRRGKSWTEPTVYALLALAAGGSENESYARGIEWLRQTRRRDGGWPPAPGIEQSHWATALVVLLAGRSNAPDWRGGAAWLLKQTGRESGLAYRLRVWLAGADVNLDLSQTGWPWYPGAAAWVIPTAMSVLALQRARRMADARGLAERIEQGRRYLLSRACSDGGWNHGTTRALGYDAQSYPETTGIALLALKGAKANLGPNIACAERHLVSCRSAEGAAWLEIALRAHGRAPSPAPAATRRTLLDHAVSAIAARAAEGVNVFLD